MTLTIREAIAPDQAAISAVIMAAFGDAQGSEIAELVQDLLTDPTALPLLSLVAVDRDRTGEEQIVGHILFTNTQLVPTPQITVKSAILAPLAIHPNWQNQGIGGQLITKGLNQLKAAEVALVFVLGYPDYYGKFGFSIGGSKGFEASNPIPPDHAEGWMVQELRPGIIGSVTGKVRCADSLNDPKHW